MKISAVILSFNSNRTLGRCLDQLAGALLEFGSENEIFVVDNGSTDGSVDTIKLSKKKYSSLINPILFSHCPNKRLLSLCI